MRPSRRVTFDAAGEVGRKRRLGIRPTPHLQGERPDLRIGKRLRLQVGQAEAAFEQTGRDHELRAELGLVVGGRALLERRGLGDDVQGRLRQEGLDIDDVLRIDLAVEFDGRIGAPVDEMADGIRLERGLAESPDLAQARRQLIEIDPLKPRLEGGSRKGRTCPRRAATGPRSRARPNGRP